MWKSDSNTLIPDVNLEPSDDGNYGYNCHKCGEWYNEEKMASLDRAKDTVYYCPNCWPDVEIECGICSLLHHPDEPCDHDGQGVYGGA